MTKHYFKCEPPWRFFSCSRFINGFRERIVSWEAFHCYNLSDGSFQRSNHSFGFLSDMGTSARTGFRWIPNCLTIRCRELVIKNWNCLRSQCEGNIVNNLLSMKLITVFAVAFFIGIISGQSVKHPTSISMYLIPDGVAENGPANSIDIVSKSANVGTWRAFWYLGFALCLLRPSKLLAYSQISFWLLVHHNLSKLNVLVMSRPQYTTSFWNIWINNFSDFIEPIDLKPYAVHPNLWISQSSKFFRFILTHVMLFGGLLLPKYFLKIWPWQPASFRSSARGHLPSIETFQIFHDCCNSVWTRSQLVD